MNAAVQTVHGGAKLVAITLIRSAARRAPRVRETLRVMGLTRMHKTVYYRNDPVTRGWIQRVCSSLS